MTKKNIIFWISKTIKTFIAVILVIVGFFGGAVLRDQLFNFLPNVNEVILYFFGTIIQIVFLILFLWITSKVDGKKLKDYGVYFRQGDLGFLFKGIGVGVVLFTITILFMYIFKAYGFSTNSFTWNDIIIDFFGCIAVGVVEEYVFRGFLLHKLSFFGKIPAIILSSAIFAFVHLGNQGASPIAIANIVLAGIFFAMLLYITNSIFTAIGFHFAWDFVQGSIFGVPFGTDKQYGIFKSTIIGDNPILTGGNFGIESSIISTSIMAIAVVIIIVLAYKKGVFSK